MGSETTDGADDGMAMVFKALADPTRRRLLDRLHADNGQTLIALSRELDMSRQGVTAHLDVLVAAGVVTTVKHGREKLHYLNPVPLHEIQERWISKFEEPDLDALSHLKRRLEREHTMEKPQLVYVTFIASTPERVWDALTDPEETATWWAHRNVSTWKPGDSWQHTRLSDGGVDVGGKILEFDPPRRLAHTFSETDDPSRVTFDVEAVDDSIVKLTMTHVNLTPEDFAQVNQGWPVVLSSLKSYLETGNALTDAFWKKPSSV